ncbi:MAG: hypothetical protein ACTSUO_06100 [Candidatus Thorarchaeota archaeon]
MSEKLRFRGLKNIFKGLKCDKCGKKIRPGDRYYTDLKNIYCEDCMKSTYGENFKENVTEELW